MRKHKVRAVHDDDLLELLDSIGIRQSIEEGQTKCHVCGETITLDTLQAILPFNKKIVAVCNRPTCVKSIETDL